MGPFTFSHYVPFDAPKGRMGQNLHSYKDWSFGLVKMHIDPNGIDGYGIQIQTRVRWNVGCHDFFSS